MAKIAIVGAGSMQFTRQVISDLVRFPALQPVFRTLTQR